MKALLTKLKSLIKRGYVTREASDTGFYPIVQVSYLGKIGDAEIVTPYGYNCNFPVDTPVIIMNLQGFENNRICIPFLENDRFKNLAVGEVKFGIPPNGSYIYFKADGKIEIESKDDLDITVTGNVNLTVSGNVNVDATQVNLGVGGNQIARVGDNVVTTIGGTPYTGQITTGGINTSI